MLAWVFSYVYTLTQGGPGTATITMELYIYNVGEAQSTPGMALPRRRCCWSAPCS